MIAKTTQPKSFGLLAEVRFGLLAEVLEGSKPVLGSVNSDFVLEKSDSVPLGEHGVLNLLAHKMRTQR
jgi:hypothetical protein